MTKFVGILTSGGDCPGLNAAIRGVGKSGIESYGMQIIGFRDGFRGVMQDRTVRLDGKTLSGILTLGGTILGTSRDKPHRMPVGGKIRDMTDAMVDTYHRHHLDVLVCLGGGGTQKNALRLKEKGLNIITLPKTIDNDVAMTDVTFGFDTALEIATEAIDRLHSTATSHNRIIVVEIMGNQAGWLALGAGIAGGADVILIPEIPYDTEKIAAAIRRRTREGKHFSIVAVAEGAMTVQAAAALREAEEEALKKESKKGSKTRKSGKGENGKANKSGEECGKATSASKLEEIATEHVGKTLRLTAELEALTGQESRLTILGHLQRGGTPSAADRVLATRLGTVCARLIEDNTYGVMVAARGMGAEPVALEEVAGKRKTVPLDHPWIETARQVGTCFGD